jgi:hypothetical protein
VYNIEVYTGKRSDLDGSPTAVIKRLLTGSGFEAEEVAGRTMYCDNWYTSLTLLRDLGRDFNMAVVGTVTLTTKKSRTATDVPFSKPSGPATKSVSKGFMRRAVAKMTDIFAGAPKWMYVQAVAWKDNKFFGVLSSILIGPADADDHVLRYSKETRKREEVSCHPVVKEYAKYMGAVDRADRDIKEWGTNTKRRSGEPTDNIAYYLLDINSNNNHRIATYDHADRAPPAFKKYCRKKDKGTYPANSRYNFQRDMALAMMTLGLEREWGADGNPPSWARQVGFIPCGCGKCFFCEKGLTNGIMHKPRQAKKRKSMTPNKTDCTRHVETETGKCSACYQVKKERIEAKAAAAGRQASCTDFKNAQNNARLKCLGCAKKFCSSCAKGHKSMASGRSDRSESESDDLSD